MPQDTEVVVEVGHRLLRDHWGQGYATEMAIALLRYGFDDQGLSRVVGACHPVHLASSRVLLKSGLSYAGSGRYDFTPVDVYAATRAAWRAPSAAQPI